MEVVISGIFMSLAEVLSVLIVVCGLHGKKLQSIMPLAAKLTPIIIVLAWIANAVYTSTSDTLLTIAGIALLVGVSYWYYNTSVKRIITELSFIVVFLCICELMLIAIYGGLQLRPGDNLWIDGLVSIALILASITTLIRGWFRTLYLSLSGDRIVWITDAVILALLVWALAIWKMNGFFGAGISVFFLILISVACVAGGFFIVYFRKRDEERFVGELNAYTSMPEADDLALLEDHALSGIIAKAITENRRSDIDVSITTSLIHKQKIKMNYKVIYDIVRIAFAHAVSVCDAGAEVMIMLSEHRINKRQGISLSFFATHADIVKKNDLMKICSRLDLEAKKKDRLRWAKRLTRDNNGEFYLDYLPPNKDTKEAGSILIKIML